MSELYYTRTAKKLRPIEGLENKKNKYNLGCGFDYRKGWINVSNNRSYPGDVFFNLNKYPWTFIKTNSADHITMNMIMEHLIYPVRKDGQPRINTLIYEVHRCLKKGGTWEFVVPHHSHKLAFQPDHETVFNEDIAGFVCMSPKDEACYFKEQLFELVSLELIYSGGLVRFIPFKKYLRHFLRNMVIAIRVVVRKK